MPETTTNFYFNSFCFMNFFYDFPLYELLGEIQMGNLKNSSKLAIYEPERAERLILQFINMKKLSTTFQHFSAVMKKA